MRECIICNGAQKTAMYAGISKCIRCGHIFFDTRLNNDELDGLYSKAYFCGNEYADYLADQKTLVKNFELRFRTLRNFIHPNRHRYLLEIGCAYGFFLMVVKKYFREVHGIDISEDGTRYARDELKLNVVKGEFLKHDFGSQKFDVVCMWDTIEHLQDPHLYIEKISRHLETGALIAITTGDIGSLNARLRKEKWRLIHPPTHIHYFSKKTLTLMLDTYGFDVVYNRWCGFYRSMDLAVHRTIALNNVWPWLLNFLRKMGITGINFYLNLYDIMFVVARKR